MNFIRKLVLGALLLLPLSAHADIDFFWRCEGTTLDATHDESQGDTTASATGTMAIDATAALIGSNGCHSTGPTSFYEFTDDAAPAFATPGSIVVSVGYWARWPTTLPSVGNALGFFIRGTASANDEIETQLASSNEVQLRIKQNGGSTLSLTTPAANLAANTTYKIIFRLNMAQNDRAIEVYDSSCNLISSNSDVSTSLSGAVPADLNRLIFGRMTPSGQGYYDNLLIEDTYEGVVCSDLDQTSFTGFSPAPLFSIIPASGTLTQTTIATTFTSDQTGTVEGVACPDGQTAPTVTQVFNDQCTGDVAAAASFDEAVVAGVADGHTFTGLTRNTVYDLHFAIDTAVLDSAAISSVANVTTVAAPTFTAGPTAGTITSESLPVTFTSSQTGTVKGVVCPDGQAAPTVAHVLAGQCTGAVAAVATFSEPVDAGSADGATFVGLTPATTYDTHYAQTNSAGDSSAISSLANQITTAAAGISFTTGPTITPILNGYQIDYEVNDDARISAVACNPGDAAPSFAEILLGQCGGGNASEMAAAQVTSANTPDSMDLTAAGQPPRKNVYVTAESVTPVPAVEVYPTVAGHASAKWQCTIEGITSPVLFVVNDWGEANNADLSDRNHWTQFSSQDWPVTVVCASRGGTVSSPTDITSAFVRPERHAITPTVDTGADSVTFDIPGPGQYFIGANSLAQEDPLFVFASEMDTNVPTANGTTIKNYAAGMDMTGVTTVVFEPGIYDLDTAYPQAVNCNTTDDSGCVRTPLEVRWGVEYYIKGGAWVDGQMNLACSGNGTGQFKLRGRGTLTGEQFRPSKEDVTYRMFYNSSNCSLGTMAFDGITVALTPRQSFVTFDNAFTFNDMKIMSFTGDGVRMTNGSVVSNSFFKVNDDSFKPFSSNTTATDNVIYLQKTGVGVLLSWNTGTDISNVLIDGLDVIESTRATYSSQPGDYTQAGESPCITNSVFGVQNMGAAHIHDVIIKNVRLDVPMWMIFQFKNKGCLTGFINGANSEISEITFQNWSGDNSEQPNIINGNGTNPGTIHDFHFINVSLGGTDWDSGDIGTLLKFCTVVGETCTDSSATFTFAP